MKNLAVPVAGVVVIVQIFSLMCLLLACLEHAGAETQRSMTNRVEAGADCLNEESRGYGRKRRKPARTMGENSICGRVPIYEDAYGLSINESFSLHTGDQDDDYSNGFRILYGIDAVKGEWPWIVKLNMCNATAVGQNEQTCYGCTGSLINSRWVLTAGHCAFGNVRHHWGQLGRYDLLLKESSVVDITFDRMIQHPNFNPDSLDNDLTLLRLRRPVAYGDFVGPVCVVDRAHGNAKLFSRLRRCYNIGYGMLQNDQVATKLQKLEVEAKSREECERFDLGSMGLMRNHVCMGPKRDQMGASCRGDSGGPNVCYDPHTNQWFLFSTVSYGPVVCDRLEGDHWLSASVDLAKYLGWIRRTMASHQAS